jgi:hypothetical protein
MRLLQLCQPRAGVHDDTSLASNSQDNQGADQPASHRHASPSFAAVVLRNGDIDHLRYRIRQV